MKSKSGWIPAVTKAMTLLAMVAGIAAPPLEAANTGTQELLKITGSGAPLGFGDYVTNIGGLDTFYSVFFEVPEGLTSFEVDLYDADIGIGDPDPGIRDRERGGYDTTVEYRLYDPNGTLAATLNCNSDPDCLDGAWTNFATAGSTAPGDSVLDEFSSQSYSNNDGSVNWSTDWVENGDDGSPTSGTIFVATNQGGQLRLTGTGGGDPYLIERATDLSPGGNDFSTATLSFRWRTSPGVDVGEDFVAVEAMGNGNGWSQIGPLLGRNLGFDLWSEDISAFIGPDTAIRFVRSNGYTLSNERFIVDDVQIQDSDQAAVVTAGHWELQIDQSSAETTGDDINGLGIRAHDGASDTGGTEINAYMLSYAAYGSNDGTLQRNYQHHLYMTSGCDFDLNEFDWDSEGSIQLNGPVSFAQNLSVSGDETWSSSNITNFTSLARAEEYGIWTLGAQIVGPASGTGNYATLYSADFNSSGTPPTTQPEAGSYRIYLSSDGADGDTAGSEPGKFRLSQLLAFSSGANPPTPGNPGRYGVTLVAENPASASGDVIFDSTNLIIANVPGGDVVYVAGSAQTDTGAVGFSGSDVEWNPGILAPGDVATMWYQVDVTDDGSSSILATGSPGSNGTRGSFTDETGELNQEWTEGLCELAVDLQGPTAVTLRSFEAYVDDGGVMVEWATDAEAGTIGFDLWRLDTGKRDFVKVNKHPLTGLLSAPQGGIYRLRDDRAPTSGDLTYMLVEEESKGRERVYGPFTVQVQWDRQAEALPVVDSATVTFAGDFTKSPHRTRQSPAQPRAAKPDRSVRPALNLPKALKLSVGEPGLYRVEAQEIANGLGIPLQKALAYLSSGRFVLTQNGVGTSWILSADAQALEFYGEKTASPYTAENVYRLATNRVDGPSPRPRDDKGLSRRLGRDLPRIGMASTFRETVRIDENLFPVLVMELPEGADFWFWDYVRFGDPAHESKAFTFSLPGVDGDVPFEGSLTVHLQGATAGQHELELFLDGTWIGLATLHDLDSVTYTTRFFNQGLLNNGAYTLELVAVNGDLVFLDYVEVEYDRRYDAGLTGSLHHRGDLNREVTVSGFANRDVRVFDLSDPSNPRLERKAWVRDIGDSYAVTYSPRSGDTPYLAVEEGGVLRPLSIVPDYQSDLKSPQQGADYLIITTAEMVNTAASLAAYRQSQMHVTKVIDVADIFDEFSHGIAHPPAIREFLTYAYQHWSKAPRYVLIAANGTWDYRDNLGHGDNLVPPMFRAGSSDAPGLYATDYPFGDAVGDDWIWEMAVGRISVTSPAELQSYIDKIIAYENGFDGGPRDSVLVLTDNPDGSGDYLSDGLALSALLPPGLTPLQVQLGPLDLETARAQLFAALDTGVPVMTYHGHAGMTVLAHEGLLTSADVPDLTNAGRTPVVNAVTCFVASFASPGFDSLAEELVIHPDGGAAAVWASLYYSSNTQTQFLADRFFRQVFHEGEAILGDAVMGAIQSAAGHVSEATLRRTAILGDPALRFQHEAVSVPPNPTPGE